MEEAHSQPDNNHGESWDLHNLEPSPVEEEDPLLSPDTLGSTSTSISAASDQKRPLTGSSALGLRGHGAVYYLTRVQKYSSYTFGVFLAMHITNNALIPLVTRSVPASEPYLLLTRPYYQSTVTEPLVVILPLLAHIGSGVVLRLYRRLHLSRRYGAESRADRRRLTWPVLTGTSTLGYLLTPFVLGHIAVNRLLPYWFNGGSSASIGLSFVSHGFAKHPTLAFSGYVLLLSLASFHFVWGAAKWLGYHPTISTSSKRRTRTWYLLNALAASLTTLWALGGLGVVGRAGLVPGWLGRRYDELYAKIPLIGSWL